MNILLPTPKIKPSDLYSIAGDTIELEKPVIGTIEPAPAYLPILLYNLREVSNAPINIRLAEVIVAAVNSSIPLFKQISLIICPIIQIKPPTIKAKTQFLTIVL